MTFLYSIQEDGVAKGDAMERELIANTGISLASDRQAARSCHF